MSEMIERVADAIFEVIWPAQEWDGLETKCRAVSEVAARKAVEAMRNPSIRMHNAAALGGLCGKAPWIDAHGTICHELADPSAVYRAMIDAALEAKP